MMRTLTGVLLAGTILAPLAHGQTAPAAPATGTGPAAAAAAPAAAATVTLPSPGMNGPLAFPSVPYSIDVGPLGKWYIDGAVTGLGLVQSNRTAVDRDSYLDLSNGEIIVQKLDGWWQFYIQAGGYSLPAIGAPYTPNNLTHSWGNYYTALPLAFLKIQPFDNFSIQAGRLAALIGYESTFTFENPNIERGLLWAQEPAISRGVQANYTLGPVAFSVSLNDGFYSNRYNWVTGSAAWTINTANTLTLAAGGNTGHTPNNSLKTPLAQNNGQIYDIIYTYNSAPWTITPWFQYTYIPTSQVVGITHAANSVSGALLVNYAFSPKFDLSARVEYISTMGKATSGAPNLLYGPGSQAFEFTVTPTYIFDKFYVRAEGSVVDAFSVTPGFGFGTNGTQKTQLRGLLEGGVLF